MIAHTLGRLTRVDLREIWTSEASDFTPRLAREENLAVLAETLGLDLELEAQEKAVGPFRADILCKDIGSGVWVLVENQLERRNHSHLGQLLTYASGLEAVTTVWVAARFRRRGTCADTPRPPTPNSGPASTQDAGAGAFDGEPPVLRGRSRKNAPDKNVIPVGRPLARALIGATIDEPVELDVSGKTILMVVEQIYPCVEAAE